MPSYALNLTVFFLLNNFPGRIISQIKNTFYSSLCSLQKPLNSWHARCLFKAASQCFISSRKYCRRRRIYGWSIYRPVILMHMQYTPIITHAVRAVFCCDYVPVAFTRARQGNSLTLGQVYDFPSDDVIKWKHFPRHWPFVRGIHRSPVNSPHNGQRRGALMFSLICAWMSGGVNNCEAGDLRRHRAQYDVTVMPSASEATPVNMGKCVTWTDSSCYVYLPCTCFESRD